MKTHTNRKRERVLVNLALYADDILIACNNLSMLEIEKPVVKREIETTDGGVAQFMFGVELIRSSTTGQLFLKQRKYIEDSLEILEKRCRNQSFSSGKYEWILRNLLSQTVWQINQSIRPQLVVYHT